jgi:hypothetical protein
MTKRVYLFPLSLLLIYLSVGAQQYPVMNMVADKLIGKYQQASCEQLWQEKAQKGAPKS